MKNKFTILFLIFLFTNSLFSQNLILNGGFEIGGSGVGFVTTFTPLLQTDFLPDLTQVNL
jgi:hypothetical protein